MKPWILAVLLIFSGACSGGGVSDPTPTASVLDSAGVRIVSLAPFDRAAASAASAVQLYSTRDNLELFRVPAGGSVLAARGSRIAFLVRGELGEESVVVYRLE